MKNDKWTTTDMADLSGRTAVVTGANSGLGLETASALAVAGAHVVLAVRNLDKGRAAIETIRSRQASAQTELVELDLADFGSVRSAATTLLDRHERIDLLVNNAGVMYTPASKTVDGFEMQFGTNHLGISHSPDTFSTGSSQHPVRGLSRCRASHTRSSRSSTSTRSTRSTPTTIAGTSNATPRHGPGNRCSTPDKSRRR